MERIELWMGKFIFIGLVLRVYLTVTAQVAVNMTLRIWKPWVILGSTDSVKKSSGPNCPYQDQQYLMQFGPSQ